MLSDKMLAALNAQIQDELHASYVYLAMSAYFEDETLTGFAKWMRLQSDEERGHAMRLYDYVYDRNGKVMFGPIERPQASFASARDAMEKALAHEESVTASINRLYDVAVEENDHATSVMLHWFIEEQVEEEKSARDIIDKLKRVGDSPAGLLMLDRELASRGSG